MSPSGLVMMREVNPEPGPVVSVNTMLAAKSKSLALVVVTAVVLLVALFPVLDEVISTGAVGLAPLYSSMRKSG
jgi:hypothetical protein